jgi:hypothetical protein
MVKKRLALHLVAIFGMVFFAFLSIGSGASTPETVPTEVGEAGIVSSVTSSTGLVWDMLRPDQLPGWSPLGRQFDVIDIVFATSVTEFDADGREISSQEGIVTLLLREAHKLGGNDILNLRVDENVVTYVTQMTVEGSSGATTRTVVTKKVTYTGSALAIRYHN